jgi:L-serine dehydratase
MTTSRTALPSAFEILKPAVGPSSSHTLGPMTAAREFAKLAATRAVDAGRIRVELFGSLALTGRGHLTDLALAAGLAGYGPRELAGTSLHEVAQRVREAGRVRVGKRELLFDADQDVAFNVEAKGLPHPNTMRFSLLAPAESQALETEEILSETYYSIGGGRLAGGALGSLSHDAAARGSISMNGILAECAGQSIDLVEYVYRTEEAEHGHARAAVAAHVDEMWMLMMKAMERGLAAEGTLPGTLRLDRRARDRLASRPRPLARSVSGVDLRDRRRRGERGRRSRSHCAHLRILRRRARVPPGGRGKSGSPPRRDPWRAPRGEPDRSRHRDERVHLRRGGRLPG